MASRSAFTLLRRAARQVRAWTMRPSGTGNPRAAGICVLLSLLLWLALTLRQRHVQGFDARTEVVSLPPGEGLAAPVPSSVHVLVEGTGFRLLPLFSSPPRLTINATQREVNLESQLASLPPDVRLIGVSPRTIRLETGELITRRVPVGLRVLFDFATSFDFAGPLRVVPESIAVTGARAVVENLRAWPTAPLRYSSVRDTLHLTVPLADTLAGLVTRPRSSVTVQVPVAAYTGGEREVEIRVTGMRRGGESISLSPSTLRVRFRVLLGQYDEALDALDFYATIPYDEIERNRSGVLRPYLHLPRGLSVRDAVLVPETVTYYRVIGPETR